MKTQKPIFKGCQNLLQISIIILSFVIIGCTSNSSSKKRTEIDNSNQQIHEIVNVLDLECKEIACFIPVDSSIARSLVPIEHRLYIEESKAQILFLAQNCHTAIWDKNDISPLNKAHIWIRLYGQDTITPVPGVDATMPTFFWWDYKGKTTNKSLEDYTEAIAWEISLIDSLEYNPTEYGKLVENINGKSQIILEWFTSPADIGEPLGINHILYGRNENGYLTANISGIIRPVSSGGQTRIEINPESPISIFGTKLYGMSLDFDMTFQAVFKTTKE